MPSGDTLKYFFPLRLLCSVLLPGSTSLALFDSGSWKVYPSATSIKT